MGSGMKAQGPAAEHPTAAQPNVSTVQLQAHPATESRFKPAQPKIPGVPDPQPRQPQASQPELSQLEPPQEQWQRQQTDWRSALGLYLWNLLSQPRVFSAICAVLALCVIGSFLVMAKRSRTEALAAAAAAQPLPTFDVPVDAIVPNGPGEIATTQELSQPWSSKRFNFSDPLTHANIPAMVVHLPGGAYWGFSLREPYGNCTMEYVTDLHKLEQDYFFHARHPMVADPCDRSIFDLASYNQGDTGLVRGAVVHGAAIRPPIAIQVRVKGQKVEAVRME